MFGSTGSYHPILQFQRGQMFAVDVSALPPERVGSRRNLRPPCIKSVEGAGTFWKGIRIGMRHPFTLSFYGPTLNDMEVDPDAPFPSRLQRSRMSVDPDAPFPSRLQRSRVLVASGRPIPFPAPAEPNVCSIRTPHSLPGSSGAECL